MRTTRIQSKQQPQKQEEEASKSTLKGKSKVGVGNGKLLKRVNSRGGGLSKTKKSRNLDQSDATTAEISGIGNDEEKVSMEATDSAVGTDSISLEKDVEEGRSISLDNKEDADEFDWEDGYISGGESIYGNSDNNVAREMVIEFNDSPSSSSKRKPIRRASAEDKELAELAHKTHLLCLLARGRLVDRACNDPLIQAALLSFLPTYLQKMTEVPKLTAEVLGAIVRWFHENFHVTNPTNSERPFQANLAAAFEYRKGTAEEICALSVALFRALNLSTRYVSILDAASLKPDMGMSSCLSQDAVQAENDIFKSSTLMVAKSDPVSIPPTRVSLPKTGFIEDSGTSHGGARKIKESSLARRIDQSKSAQASGAISDRKQDMSASDKSNASIACSIKKEGSKRKGDLEYELQLEMALAATAAGAHDAKLGSEMKDLPCSSSHNSSPYKKLKTVQGGEFSNSRQGISIAIGSRKVGAPLYWAEVFCSGENMAGKWVHVDAVNCIVDGEQKVEAAAAACRRSLRYVVAFAGNGAKDVTRRYCMKWYQIASKRINSCWWDAVLAPLKDLESVATAGLVYLEPSSNNTSSNLCKVKASEERSSTEEDVISSSIQEHLPGNCSTNQNHGMKDSQQNLVNIGVQSSSQCGVTTRNSLEDMELQTRALTEPLPTNQQAYRNHHLYALERWLTKNQILHPKGPILGYCSGHPVYPRNCVQTLHSEHRWLREALQVKASEKPAKLVKRSSKIGKAQASEPEADKEDEGEENIALYGRWQLEPLNLPYAVNGVVPRNERGQVDVWSEKCLPHGTVHLRLPRVYTVAKRLGIDSAPAMVGFDFRNGRTVPIFEGIVVCTEFKDAILQAYAEEEERREAEEKKRNESQAISRWYQLLSSIITRRRLNQTYGADSCSQTSHVAKQNANYICGTVITADDMQSNVQHRQDYVHNSSSDFTQDHEHIYPIDNQSFDEESSVRTKRCPCGFSVQVEEL